MIQFRHLCRSCCLGLLIPLALSIASTAQAKDPSEVDWKRYDVLGFTVYSSAPEKKSRSVIENLLRFREALSVFLPTSTFESPIPTHVYLVGRRKTFDTLQTGPGSEPSTTAGSFISTADANYMMVDLSHDMTGMHIAYHEYVHFVIRHTIPALPLWANEGLAEFFSSFHSEGRRVEVGHAIEHHARLIQEEGVMPLATLFGIDERSSDYRGGHRQGQFYAQSWALVHTLITSDPPLREAFMRYCSALQQGATAQSAMIEHLQFDETKLMNDLRRRMGFKKLPALAAELDLPPELDEIGEGTKLSPIDVQLKLGMLMASTPQGPHQLARRYFNRVLKAHRYAAEAHVGLAALCRWERNGPQARAHLERALAAAPDSPAVLDAYGEFLLEYFDESLAQRSYEVGEQSPELLRARELFSASLESHPQGARALAGLALSFHLDADIPTAAVDAARLASARYPDSQPLAMAHSLYLSRNGQHEEAWAVYQQRFLPLRPSRESVQFVLSSLSYEALEASVEMAREGRVDEATAFLEQVLHQHDSRELAESVRAEFNEAVRHFRGSQLVERFNEGVAAANSGERRRALEIFKEVARDAEDPSLKEAAEKAVKQLLDGGR